MVLQYLGRTLHYQFSSNFNCQRLTVTVFILLLLYGRADSGKKNPPKLVHSSHQGPNSIKNGGDDVFNLDIDVVDYGEDCSPDGPFCNEALHLVCDPEEETCLCNAAEGYVHIDSVRIDDYYRYTSGVCVHPVPEPVGVRQPELVIGTRLIPNAKPPLKPTRAQEEDDFDIVGFGEDCSDDGPFCDFAYHLICDPVEEACVCDSKAGYLHIDEVPGGREHHWTEDTKNVCVSQEDISERAEQLLGINKEGSMHPSIAKRAEELDMHLKNFDFFTDENIVETEGQEDITPSEGGNKLADIYNRLMGSLPDENAQDDIETRKKRLAPFKLDRNLPEGGTFSDLMKDLSVVELMKYGKGVWDRPELRGLIRGAADLYFDWMDNPLLSHICGMIFDVDQDGITTHQEYAIVILSETVQYLMVKKVFNILIRSLAEETCITIDDLRVLEPDPVGLQKDFRVFDKNGDGCFSYPEFEYVTDTQCHINWHNKVVKSAGLHWFAKKMDPTPEEMYIRRLFQETRLRTNWRAVDQDGDGLVSLEELQLDLVSFGIASEGNYDQADSLLTNLDHNGDGKIALREVAITISVPALSEEYQFEWLESLFELYETDEEEVKEYLASFLNEDDNYNLLKPSPSKGSVYPKHSDSRILTIFDKNRDGELDEVEFKLLLEIMKKYVVHGLLNETLASIDTNADHKLSVFEYQAFFNSASSKLQLYLKNLLTVVLQHEDIVESETNADEDDEDNYVDNGDGTVSLRRSPKKNETLLVFGLFKRLDSNSDGFLTKDDFYGHVSSFHLRLSDYELQKEFSSMDSDGDGVLTEKDSGEFAAPVDFKMYKEHAYLSEEVFPSDFDNQLWLMDINKDGRIQVEEFRRHKELLIQDEEEEFVNWVEFYFGNKSPQMDPEGEKTFREFDDNCDGLISEEEFSRKLNELLQKTDLPYLKFSGGDFTEHFKRLDLNKDEKVSYNEFHFLLLRNNKRINEK